MKKPDWRNLNLDEGVLREPLPDDQRVVLWLPGGLYGGYRHWERVGTVPGAGVTVAQGVCATPATAIRARQRVGGFFGRLLQRFRKGPGEQTWVLPNGESAEQAGERQTDLVLAWAEDDTVPLGEAELRARWPEGKRFRKVGKSLFLVGGVETR